MSLAHYTHTFLIKPFHCKLLVIIKLADVHDLWAEVFIAQVQLYICDQDITKK